MPIDTSPDLCNNGAEAKVRADGSRRPHALAKHIDVVAQNDANTRALSQACAGCGAAGCMQLRCVVTPFANLRE